MTSSPIAQYLKQHFNKETIQHTLGLKQPRFKADGSPRVYVRRNGSRYIYPGDLFDSPKFRETMASLKDFDPTTTKSSC